MPPGVVGTAIRHRSGQSASRHPEGAIPHSSDRHVFRLTSRGTKNGPSPIQQEAPQGGLLSAAGPAGTIGETNLRAEDLPPISGARQGPGQRSVRPACRHNQADFRAPISKTTADGIANRMSGGWPSGSASGPRGPGRSARGRATIGGKTGSQAFRILRDGLRFLGARAPQPRCCRARSPGARGKSADTRLAPRRLRGHGQPAGARKVTPVGRHGGGTRR